MLEHRPNIEPYNFYCLTECVVFSYKLSNRLFLIWNSKVELKRWLNNFDSKVHYYNYSQFFLWFNADSSKYFRSFIQWFTGSFTLLLSHIIWNWSLIRVQVNFDIYRTCFVRCLVKVWYKFTIYMNFITVNNMATLFVKWTRKHMDKCFWFW